MLVDSTVGHSMLFFMDGVFWIQLDFDGSRGHGEDVLHYRVGAYHLAALERFFERIRQFRLRLNPKKCTFGVTYGKLLGYMCQCAFERIREYLLSPPVLVPPTLSRHLLLYLLVSDIALGMHHFCLALVWATQRPRHYMTKYPVHLISRLDPLRYLFDKPAMVGRLMRWLVLLIEFDIHYVTQKSIKGSIIVDHFASLPVSDGRAIDDDFPDEDIATMTSLSGWCMYFDGAANHSGYGIGVLLISPHGDHIPRFVHLAFSDRHPTTNNIVEYEASILELETVLELRIRQIEVFGDSNLIIASLFRDVQSVRYMETSFMCTFRVTCIDFAMAIFNMRPQTNGSVEAMNRILRESYKGWSRLLGIVLPVEIEIGSLRVTLEHHISELTPRGAAWLMDLDGNQFSEPTNVDQLKRVTLVSMLVDGSSYVSFPRPSILCIHLVVYFESEMSDLLLGTLGLILGYIPLSIEICRSSWSCMLIPTYEIHAETTTFLLSYHDPVVGLLLSHSLWIWMTRITHLMMDDLMLSSFLIYHTSGVILGHIRFQGASLEPSSQARTFRATISSQLWRSKPPSFLSFGVQSHHLFVALRLEPPSFLSYGVQSHHLFSVWRSEPPSLFSLVFRATISAQLWHSKPPSLFNLAFRATFPS
ncbi:hypothetical protein CK203_107187 [Vitis vinifera]|uniref:Reverse transcriptase RNase H-like domain-containing protein n=1 Tax=Vitis vinifera TaxID=29760 RepID=A0A438DBM1_VITVI|nr:hypothetical protein CK203_107187 [Vitis vinifera]